MARKIPLYIARIGHRPERINRKDLKWRDPKMERIYVKWSDVAPYIKESDSEQPTTSAMVPCGFCKSDTRYGDRVYCQKCGRKLPDAQHQ